MWKPMRHGPGALVRRRHEGLGGSQSPLQASGQGANRAVGAEDGWGRQAAGVRGTVALLPRTALAPCAAGTGLRRGQAEPGATVLVLGPRAPVGAQRGQHGLRHGSAAARPGPAIDARHTQEGRTRGDCRRLLTVRVGRATWRCGGTRGSGRLGRGRAVGGEDRDGACALRVARAALDGVAIAERSRLRAHTQMRRAPGTGPCQRQRLRLLRAAVMAPRRQGVRSTLARHAGPEQLEAGGARASAERVRPREGHLHECLRHVEDLRSTRCAALGALASQRPERHAGRVRPTRGGPEPGAGQGLEPRPVEASALASRDALHGWGAAQAAVEARRCPCLAERHPRDARGGPGTRRDATVPTPVCARLASRGVRATGAPALLVRTSGPTGHARMGPTVDTSGLGGARAPPSAWAGVAWSRAGTLASAALAHGGTPGEDATRPSAITLAHLWSRACAAGSKPPVSDAGVSEDQRAGRDARHHSVVGSARVLAPLSSTLWRWGGTALFLPWGLPVRAWWVQATAACRA